MPLFKYKAMDRRGKIVEGSSNATSQAALTEILRDQGLFLTTAFATSVAGPATKEAPAAGAKSSYSGRPRPITLKDLVVFNNEFALMVRSSTPILEAMMCLASQQKNPTLRNALYDISKGIQQGQGICDSFQKYPTIFDDVYIALLDAGESSGSLPQMLDRITGHLNFTMEIKTKIRAAMIYPLVVFGTALLVVLGLVFFILPIFAEVFSQFDVDLPLLTRVLLNGSNHVRSWLVFYFVAAGGLWWYARNWYRTASNRATIDSLSLRVPFIGPLMRSLILARVLRTLGELLRGNVPILKALDLAQATAGNVVYSKILGAMRQQVAAGHGLAPTLARSPDVPDMVSHMVGTAEKTGTLPDALGFVADYYTKEVDTTLHNLFAIMEPMFVAFLGGVVGTIAVGILLPIFQLGGLVQ